MERKGKRLFTPKTKQKQKIVIAKPLLFSSLLIQKKEGRKKEREMRKGGNGETTSCALVETKEGRHSGGAYRAFAATVMASIFLIWAYRATGMPGAGHPGRWTWMGMFISEIMFGVYWILSQSLRWRPTFNFPFKHKLSLRYYIVSYILPPSLPPFTNRHS